MAVKSVSKPSVSDITLDVFLFVKSKGYLVKSRYAEVADDQVRSEVLNRHRVLQASV